MLTSSPGLAADDCKVPFDFSGRVCIVTGAGQGIGRSIACVLAAHGATVIIADRSAETGEAVRNVIVEMGGLAHSVELDVADHARLGATVAEIDRQFGRIDVVVHNAAVFPLMAFDSISPDLLERTLAVNLKAAFWLTQAALPAFKRLGRGRVLVTSSVTGPRVAYPGLAHYAASKAGVNGFIRAAALELAKYGVTVNGVEPGMIATPAMSNLGGAEQAAALTRGVPLGRLGAPLDIAFAMAFFASDAASYITGQTLVVDGGALLPECGVRP